MADTAAARRLCRRGTSRRSTGLADRAAGRPAELELAGDHGRLSSAGPGSSSTSGTRRDRQPLFERRARRSPRARSCGRRSRKRSTGTRSTGSSTAASTGELHDDPPGEPAWYDATKVPCTPYDPADAKRLVAASGFSNPTVHLLTRNATDSSVRRSSSRRRRRRVDVRNDRPDRNIYTSVATRARGTTPATPTRGST